MTDLEDALDTLKNRLGNEGNAFEIVIETADEYGFHPNFLRRKFVERYHTSPEEYAPPTGLITLNRRRARKNALSWAWQSHSVLEIYTMTPAPPDARQKHEQRKNTWIAEQVRKHHLGAIFAEHGYEYAFAGLSSSGAIMAIPVGEGDPKERSAHLHRVIFQEDAEPFPWNTVQEVRPYISDTVWRMGNPELTFATKQQAYEWLQKRIIVGANENLK
ncbi:hypothetical protein SAMN05444279_11467 [Ruegeria intermedia]|uniref:Uncharacterized protein n=1 Tax=Ruegeria intermedia TaxID=996115 RepID=A0A1M4Y948_9RHOB|nr:hypothetical protein [Ruegeria intermedia]SHF02136.1 hypothetical protein SAMN05444279_11467 [Ruegeria intermedia]